MGCWVLAGGSAAVGDELGSSEGEESAEAFELADGIELVDAAVGEELELREVGSVVDVGELRSGFAPHATTPLRARVVTRKATSREEGTW